MFFCYRIKLETLSSSLQFRIHIQASYTPLEINNKQFDVAMLDSPSDAF
jgi:hypothetical protein